ncbi:hypothetical protein AGMMS49543_11550 [Betaproteobacteria bacterium]|nr:hypothetical protein AGMMS49543_11550 [Betaproteobacteria bacterium]GHU11186.1 hypothetical protein AGMMS50225_16140 [Betaproteobacteria bacterium]GHU24915.1 hypothetical protein AGMMS50243_28580 [Betaproteobacteria bacterium]
MKEKLSALLDGDVDDDMARVLLSRLGADAGLRKDWNDWCLIGDSIRGEARYMPDFVSGVMSRLDDEPTVLAPPRREEQDAPPSFWQRLAPIAASLMGVLAVAGVVATLSHGDKGSVPATPALAAAPTRAPTPPVAVAVRNEDAAWREYLLAHQAMAGGGPMPAAVQYVRTVSPQAGE